MINRELEPGVTLISPLHDPLGLLVNHINESGPALVGTYQGRVGVSVTDLTSTKTFDALIKAEIPHSILKGRRALEMGANYKNALRLGLKRYSTHLHLIDFDRALHWVRRFPQELQIIQQKAVDFPGLLSFVRTIRAFETHPYEQRSTEEVINAVASRVAGVDVDIMSGAFGMDDQTARLMVKEANRNDYGFCAEYLYLKNKNKDTISTIEVEGLEWETPDQFQTQIALEGYANWLGSFESLEQWRRRLDLIEDSGEELLQPLS